MLFEDSKIIQCGGEKFAQPISPDEKKLHKFCSQFQNSDQYYECTYPARESIDNVLTGKAGKESHLLAKSIYLQYAHQYDVA